MRTLCAIAFAFLLCASAQSRQPPKPVGQQSGQQTQQARQAPEQTSADMRCTDEMPLVIRPDAAAAEQRKQETVDTPARSPGQIMKTNILRSNLDTAAQAGVRSGHAREAEAFAKQLLEVPATSTSEAEPRERRAHANAIRAHPIAMQGRGEEALEVLAPAIEYYRDEEKAGATATYFRYDFAYALTVSAISRSDKAGQRAQRNADLDEATRVLDGASSEAKRMASFRELATLIAATRG
jgi:hypothetical protein